MHTVYHAETLVDAHLVKDYLEQAGVPAFISGEYLTGGVGQLPARDFITVGVPDSCVPAAEPLVREVTAMLAEARHEQATAERDDDDPGFLPFAC